MIISIGSISRPALHEAQRQTFGQHIKTLYFTEPNLPHCVICNATYYHSSKDSKVKFYIHSENVHPADPDLFRDDSGWWCAQKRPLMALQSVLQDLQHIPSWIMVVDDDTFVDAETLIDFTEQHKSVQPVLYGCTMDLGSSGFLSGGAGWLVNRPVLDALRAVTDHTMHWNGSAFIRKKPNTLLDGCIARQQGGDWCFFHSDWAVAACVNAIGQGDVIANTPDGYSQSVKFLQVGEPVEEKSYVTVHYSDAAQQQRLYHSREARPGRAHIHIEHSAGRH